MKPSVSLQGQNTWPSILTWHHESLFTYLSPYQVEKDKGDPRLSGPLDRLSIVIVKALLKSTKITVSGKSFKFLLWACLPMLIFLWISNNSGTGQPSSLIGSCWTLRYCPGCLERGKKKKKTDRSPISSWSDHPYSSASCFEHSMDALDKWHSKQMYTAIVRYSEDWPKRKGVVFFWSQFPQNPNSA